MYIIKLYKEIRLWQKVKAIAKENEKLLNEKGFRIDWVGRIYTVINLPEEVVTQPFSQEGYVLMRLREYDKVFLDMGIADVIYPEMTKLPNTDSFLLVLSPNRVQLTWWALIKSMFRTGLILLGLRILYVIGSTYFEPITNFLHKIQNLIF